MDRRDFLKRAVLTGLGLAGGGDLLSASSASGEGPDSDRRP